jgi:2-haloacid dehalogenase
MTKVQAVIFDIGNVLIEWQPERFYDAEIGSERRRQMFDQVDLHKMNDRVDQGQNFQKTVYEMADRIPEWSAEIKMWHDRWGELAGPKIDHTVRLLRRLRNKGIKTYALSNFGIESFAYAETLYPFLTEFDRRYISGHMGVTKPAALIYEMVELDCGLLPETLLFADDRGENIDAAKVRGWNTHLFTTAKNFGACLVSNGLLLNTEIT